MFVKKLLMVASVLSAMPWVTHASILLPAGTNYDAPGSGTLVFDEDYGSGAGKDGIGSWIGTASYTLNTDSLRMTIPSYSTHAQLMLPVDIGMTDTVIDIGIESWDTTAAAGLLTGGFNYLSSGTGKKRLAGLLSDSGGILNSTVSGGAGILSVLEGQANVLRFTSSTLSGYALYTWANTDAVSEVTVGQSGTGATNNSLVINSPRNFTIDIAWIKIYSGVSDRSAPLSIPEPASAGLQVVGALYLVGKRRRCD
ncbi:MAG: hypothetical protein IT445_18755 [Phycisphaeraceae bacterium]|nr:hypothetical protein [Phycisphaeraceae bacterium]